MSLENVCPAPAPPQEAPGLLQQEEVAFQTLIMRRISRMEDALLRLEGSFRAIRSDVRTLRDADKILKRAQEETDIAHATWKKAFPAQA